MLPVQCIESGTPNHKTNKGESSIKVSRWKAKTQKNNKHDNKHRNQQLSYFKQWKINVVLKKSTKWNLVISTRSSDHANEGKFTYVFQKNK